MTEVKQPVPISTIEAAIEVAGTALYWKSTLERIVRRAGVSQPAYDRYSHLSKFQIVRSLFDDLEAVGKRGWLVQQRLVEQLAALRGPEAKATDPEAGKKALETLRSIAVEENVLVSPQEADRKKRQETYSAQLDEKSARQIALHDLNSGFLTLHRESDKQRRGYALEALVRNLLRLNELPYTGSYRTDTDQVDGSFDLDSFTYLVEAKWRDHIAMDSDLGAFVNKVERRLESTRGLYLSMSGFREEVVALYRLAKDNRLLLMDGEDLSLILSGRFGFVEAMQEKVRAASIRGEPFQRLADLA